MKILNRWSIFAALASVCVATIAQAELVILNVDSTLSKLELSGTAFGLPFDVQHTGSLTTHYAGTIRADLTGGVFTFSGGSAINALVNPVGPFDTAPNPIGKEAGNYGATASGITPYGFQTVNGVYKDIVLDISAGTAENAVATAATFAFTSNTLDYGIAPLLGENKTTSLAGDTGDNTSLSNVTWDGTTLTIPVEFTISGSNRVQTWTGEIVAVAVPEPSSFALVSLVGVAGLFRNRSRKRA